MTGERAVDSLRLFVAITVPDAVRKEMLHAQRELQPLAPRGVVRWTGPGQFHLTLRFLGDVASDRVAGLQESLHTVCSGAPVLQLRAEGVGFFPNARSPRVIWAGINDGGGRLAALQKEIERAVQAFTAEPGGERFAGHVTLGRFKRPGHLEIKALTGRAETMGTRRFGDWTALEIELIRSELAPTGAHYTTLDTLPLGEN